MSWIWYGLAALWLVAAALVRRRACALEVLTASDEAPSKDHVFTVAPGVAPDASTRRAASAWARERGLELLDLIPRGTRAMELFGLVLLVDPRSYRDDRFARAFPAGYAMLADAGTLDRCSGPQSPESLKAFLELGQELGRVAGTRADIAVAPGLNPKRTETPGWNELSVLLGSGLGFTLWLQAFQLALLATGLIVAPAAGFAALAAYHLQLPIALAATPARPSGLARATLARSLLEIVSLVSVLRSRPAAVPEEDPIEARRAHYARALADGLDRFFEPRRSECPGCGSRALSPRLGTSDLLQGKPGRFVLEQCRDCRYTFQNPGLSARGLDYYYGDFYEGLGSERLDWVFASGKRTYEERARLVAGLQEPRRWLDVGAGHGHFCAIARDVWPETRFDGLDVGDSVTVAREQGWLDGAIREPFPASAPSMRQRYDVVSMFHYFEHTVDPTAELAAAREVLRPGGLLVIEVPNPECRLGRLLGKYWICWLQPQHQHLLPVDAMRKLLAAADFEPLHWQVREAHIPVDFLLAVELLRNQLGGFPPLPWRRRPALADRLRYGAAFVPYVFLLAVAFSMDRIVARVFRWTGDSNAYRVVARKREAQTEP